MVPLLLSTFATVITTSPTTLQPPHQQPQQRDATFGTKPLRQPLGRMKTDEAVREARREGGKGEEREQGETNVERRQ